MRLFALQFSTPAPQCLLCAGVDPEDTEKDPIKEAHDVWTMAVCTSTEHMVHDIGEDNLSMIMDSGAEEHVITKGDWQRLGEPKLQHAQVRLWSATDDDMEVFGSVVLRGKCGKQEVEITGLSVQRQNS